jgi:hypothetical protein
MDGLLSDRVRITGADRRPATPEYHRLVPFAAMSALPPEDNRRGAIGVSRQFLDGTAFGVLGRGIMGFAMKDTIRAFLFGILILLAALIPPAILLMHYFDH